MILGSNMDESVWESLKNQGTLPEYLNDISLHVAEPRLLRGTLPSDSHLHVQGMPPMALEVAHDAEDDDFDELDEVLSNEMFVHLNNLHKNGQLTNNSSLQDLKKSYDDERRGVLNELENASSIQQRTQKSPRERRELRDMNPNAILPNRLRRRGEPLSPIME